MPYIIKTTERTEKAPGSRIVRQTPAARHAVATLDAARNECADYGECILDEQMPASGWTIGPLPDGTVIEVTPIEWQELARFTDEGWRARHVVGPWSPSHKQMHRRVVLTTFNALHAPAPRGSQHSAKQERDSAC